MRPPFYSKLLHLPLELLLTINTYDLNFPNLCIPNFPLSYSILPYWCSLPQTYWTHSFLWVGHSLCSQSLNSLPLDIGPWLPPPYSRFASTSTSLSGISGQTNTLTVLKLYTSSTLFFYFQIAVATAGYNGSLLIYCLPLCSNMKATTLKAIVGFIQYCISSIKWVCRTLDSLDMCLLKDWLHEVMVNLVKSLISKQGWGKQNS